MLETPFYATGNRFAFHNCANRNAKNETKWYGIMLFQVSLTINNNPTALKTSSFVQLCIKTSLSIPIPSLRSVSHKVFKTKISDTSFIPHEFFRDYLPITAN
jgi:hypothetical protein